MGTADATDTVVHTWVSELLISPPWGVVRYAQIAAAEAICDIAKLHRSFLPGELPSISAWDRVARAARAITTAPVTPERYAVRAAYQSTALIETDDGATLDAVTGNALKAHRLANGDAGPARIVEVTRHAIRSWRRLAGLASSAIPVLNSGCYSAGIDNSANLGGPQGLGSSGCANSGTHSSGGFNLGDGQSGFFNS